MVQENESKHPREILMAMKKLGLTNEQIHELDPGENPFLNYELGDYSDYN